MSKREIEKEISQVTQLKQEIVRSVLKAHSDIFIREVVMNGRFNQSNCYSVNTHTRKARRQFNVNKEKYQEYPETKILDIKLSKKVRGFHRWKQRHEYNAENGLTVEDWREREEEGLPK